MPQAMFNSIYVTDGTGVRRYRYRGVCVIHCSVLMLPYFFFFFLVPNLMKMNNSSGVILKNSISQNPDLALSCTVSWNKANAARSSSNRIPTIRYMDCVAKCLLKHVYVNVRMKHFCNHLFALLTSKRREKPFNQDRRMRPLCLLWSFVGVTKCQLIF